MDHDLVIDERNLMASIIMAALIASPNAECKDIKHAARVSWEAVRALESTAAESIPAEVK